jgi:hypothetical protein
LTPPNFRRKLAASRNQSERNAGLRIGPASVSEIKTKRPENKFNQIISRSFGCCPSRNLGNFAQKTALEVRPSRGALKAFFCGPSEVPVMGRK